MAAFGENQEPAITALRLISRFPGGKIYRLCLMCVAIMLVALQYFVSSEARLNHRISTQYDLTIYDAYQA